MYDNNMHVIEDWNNLIKGYNEMFNGIESALSNMTNIISAIGLSISIFEMFDKSLQKSIDNLSQTIGSLDVIVDGIKEGSDDVVDAVFFYFPGKRLLQKSFTNPVFCV